MFARLCLAVDLYHHHASAADAVAVAAAAAFVAVVVVAVCAGMSVLVMKLLSRTEKGPLLGAALCSSCSPQRGGQKTQACPCRRPFQHHHRRGPAGAAAAGAAEMDDVVEIVGLAAADAVVGPASPLAQAMFSSAAAFAAAFAAAVPYHGRCLLLRCAACRLVRLAAWLSLVVSLPLGVQGQQPRHLWACAEAAHRQTQSGAWAVAGAHPQQQAPACLCK